MKIQINVVVSSNKADDVSLRLKVNEADTAAIVKERVASVQPMPFPEQDLFFNGEVLAEDKSLADAGVTAGANLELKVNASEQVFLTQLKDLLQARDLPNEELGMLYCYKYGASLNVALRAIGFQGKLEDFIPQQKGFALENGHVALVREDTKMKPFSVADEVVAILKAGNGSEDIKELCNKFQDKFNVSLSTLTGTRAGDFLAKQKNLFSVSGRVVTLAGYGTPPSPPKTPKPSQQNRSPKDLRTQATSKVVMTPVKALAPPGLSAALAPPGLSAPPAVDYNAKYEELHEKISGAAFNKRVMNVLSILMDVLLDVVFVNIEGVVKGGAIGNGTAISGGAHADLVLFVDDAPVDTFADSAPGFAKKLVAVLLENADDELSFESVVATEDVVHVKIAGADAVNVTLRFAPIFESYDATVKYISARKTRRWEFAKIQPRLAPMFAKEKLQFIKSQPAVVKVTLRLLKWWRNNQCWESELARPSDDLLEVLAVHSAGQSPTGDVAAAVSKVLSLMIKFNDLSIVWSSYYAKEDICEKMLEAKPLVMDPVNPFVNLASSASFQPKQMMALASTTGCLVK